MYYVLYTFYYILYTLYYIHYTHTKIAYLTLLMGIAQPNTTQYKEKCMQAVGCFI